MPFDVSSTALQEHNTFLANFSTQLRTGVSATDLPRFSVTDPGSGEEIALVPDAPIELAEQILSDAVVAHQLWERESARSRSNVLLRASQLLLEREDIIAATITREMGKPLAESRAEVRFSADYFRWYSEEAPRDRGEYREVPGGGAKLIITRKAIGPALLITPWNFPLAMGARKAAAALAAGCSVILKPAELTPLSSLLLADVLADAGLPERVFQVVTTSSSSRWSAALMSDVRLRKISFTGSTRVGSLLIKQSAEHVQKLSLELGGDAPFIVCDDADLDRAVDAAMISKTRNGGQACVAANRFFVQRGIAADFISAFSERLSALQLGHGLDAASTLGPMISAKAKEATTALLHDAVQHGANTHLSGAATPGEGNFFAPQLITGVSQAAEISSAEIFAPIAMVAEFDQPGEAIAAANASPFGLASYVFSQDIDRAMSIAHSLQTGVLGINKGLVADASGPFGGTGYSGYGREGGTEGMQDFQVLRQFNLDAPAQRWQH